MINSSLNIQITQPGQTSQMIEYAIKIIHEAGIGTSRDKLLELADKNGMKIRNKRIYPEISQITKTLDFLKQSKIPENHSFGRIHGFMDCMHPFPNRDKLIIRVNDRASYYSDTKTGNVRPLTRKDVIEGTKLIHVLNEKEGIVGYTCGTPQESHTVLNGIEQYMIGVRFCKFGGNTEVPNNDELMDDWYEMREIAEPDYSRYSPEVSIWSPSPMIIDAEEMDLFFHPQFKVKRLLVGSMPIQGLSGPVDPIGNMTLSLAETLGGATIMHMLFPETEIHIMPHPQSMDLFSGMLSFGTVEQMRYELLKTDLFKALDFKYIMDRGTLVSPQVSGLLTQAEKAMSITANIVQGFTAFGVIPLSADEGWSPFQCLLDIELIRDIWSLYQPIADENRCETAYHNVISAIEENQIFAAMEDTMINLDKYYQTNTPFRRIYGYQKWMESERPDPLALLHQKAEDLISEWNYSPDPSKWADVLKVYQRICKKLNTKPADFD
ncbi:MAG: hypothetical protein HC906_07135 [Bacteroidales bacterium]|nr:hypothetical protein [Bacteroidales bacterium]